MTASVPTRSDLGPVSEFPFNTITIVNVAGREIGVIRTDSEFYALRNLCPHQSGPLCRGKLARLLKASAPGAIEFERQRSVVTCPWHGWEFDVETGRALYDQTMRVATYLVEEVGGRLFITLPAHLQPKSQSLTDGRQGRVAT